MPKCIDLEALICNTFIDMLEEKPFHTIKVTELTKRANISRSTFYLYFNSIYDVAEKIENDFYKGLIDEQSTIWQSLPDTNVELSDVFRNDMLITIQYLRKNSKVYCALSGPNGDPSFIVKLNRRTRHWITQLSEKYSSSLSKGELDLLAEFVSNGVFSFQRWHLLHLDDLSDEEAADLAWKILGKSLSVLH